MGYDAALDGAVIQTRDFSFLENLNLNQTKKVSIKGGFDLMYTTQQGYSILKGTMTVGKGVVTTDRVVVK